jgi:hypothetical protein
LGLSLRSFSCSETLLFRLASPGLRIGGTRLPFSLASDNMASS